MPRTAVVEAFLPRTDQPAPKAPPAPPVLPAPPDLPVLPTSRRAALKRWALGRLLRSWGAPALADGPPVPGAAPRLRLSGEVSALGLLRDPWLTLGDAYVDGLLEVEGDLVAAVEGTFRASTPTAERAAPAGGRGRTISRSRADAQHHYDLGNDFYAQWLDAGMSYTCAYFRTPDATLEEAQAAKHEHVCRKLALRRDERVVELGAGWGALALHAARRHGVRVRAFNVSGEQVRYARDAARRAGLAERVEFVEDDYRNVTGTYDALMSVGMLEHVGVAGYPELGGLIERSLHAEGRGLLHSIVRRRPSPTSSWIERRIFPGGEIPTLGELLGVLEPWDLAVQDVEDLRPHYVLTLQRWLGRLERAGDAVRARHGERRLRTFRLYLASSVAAFRARWLHLYQVVFARGACDRLPMTRAHVYAEADAASDPADHEAATPPDARAVDPADAEAPWSPATS